MLQKTLGDITRYSSYVWQHGDIDASIRCYQMLQGMNDNIQRLYYKSVLRPSLCASVKKEHIVAACVTAVVYLWAVNLNEDLVDAVDPGAVIA